MAQEMEYERGPAADRIKSARLRARILEQEIVDSIGLGSAAYGDLEAYDDEAFMCVSLHELGSLADMLGVAPHELVAPPGATVPPPVKMRVVVESIKTQIRDRSETPDSFGDRVGWDISSALADSRNAWKDWNLDCLQDVSKAVGLKWLGVLAAWPGRNAV